MDSSSATVGDSSTNFDADTDCLGGTTNNRSGFTSEKIIDKFVKKHDDLESAVVGELEARENAISIHVGLGEEVDVTSNLAMRVASVEGELFNHGTNLPTVKVTAEFRNKTDKMLMVKLSNVDADTSDGRRIDYKLYVKDENGKSDTWSFLPTNVSPEATFTGTAYFDAEALESVIYEPHFLVSTQNQYVY